MYSCLRSALAPAVHGASPPHSEPVLEGQFSYQPK